jgi:hypothetical protein
MRLILFNIIFKNMLPVNIMNILKKSTIASVFNQ